jgi:flagellar hook-basal body complex protein FliE
VIVPIGGLEGALSAAGQSAGVGHNASLSQSEGLGQTEGSAQAGAGVGGPALGGAAGTGPEGGFSSALTNAISSLEQTQRSSDSASQALAAGTVSDPESAVVTVQDAQLEMQLAAQIRTKATEAVQSIFQTQV